MEKYKCCVVGDDGIGKKSLLNTLTVSSAPDNYSPTVQENYTADVNIEGHDPVKLEIWDVRTTDDAKKTKTLTYPNTDVFVICFSLVLPKSLEDLEEKYLNEIKEVCPDKPYILVGLRSDLRDSFETRAAELQKQNLEPVPTEKGEEIANTIGASAYVECSALKTKNVDKVFETAVHLILDPNWVEPDSTEGGCCIIY